MASRPTPQRSLRQVTAALIIAVSFCASLTASAASLGGISAGSLFTQELDVSIEPPQPPTPIVFTDFSGCSNFIDGWTDESGTTWTSHLGNWQCLGSGVVRAQQRVPLASLTVEIGQSTGIRISTQVSDISHQNNRSGPGLLLLGDGAGGFIYVVYERDEARLVIATASGADIGEVNGLPDRDSASLAVEVTEAGLLVELDGERYGPFPVPSGMADNIQFGLVSDNDNQSRFDSFTIELWP